MALRENQLTSTVTNTASTVVTNGRMGDRWEIFTQDQPIWVKVGPGVTAVASAAGNDYIPAGGYIVVDIPDTNDDISAIRAGATSATVTVTRLSSE